MHLLALIMYQTAIWVVSVLVSPVRGIHSVLPVGQTQAYPFLCTTSVKANIRKEYPSQIITGLLYLGKKGGGGGVIVWGQVH